MTNEVSPLVPPIVQSIFNRLSPEHQQETLRRLALPDQRWQRYHELLVGQALLDLGYNPELDRDFAGRTPDWFIPSNNTSPEFIVECATRNLSYDSLIVRNIINDLLGHLEHFDLPSDRKVVINVTDSLVFQSDPNHRRRNAIPRKEEMDRNILVVEQIATWISANPAIGSSLETIFGLAEMTRRLSSTDGQNRDLLDRSWSATLQEHEIDPDPLQTSWLLDDDPLNFPERPPEGTPSSLRTSIEAKVEKYDHLGLPLVVAIAADKETLLDIDDIADVLLGKRLHTTDKIERTDTIKRTHYGQATISSPIWPAQQYRSQFGIFHEKRNKSLSAVIFVDYSPEDRSILWPFFNPNAANILPDHVFPR